MRRSDRALRSREQKRSRIGCSSIDYSFLCLFSQKWLPQAAAGDLGNDSIEDLDQISFRSQVLVIDASVRAGLHAQRLFVRLQPVPAYIAYAARKGYQIGVNRSERTGDRAGAAAGA